jgi:SWI/SNF-related matrix-associated actin-dependent regulator of chromatin subfamily A3
MHVKCVGIRYYKGVIERNEMALLDREPNNPYDRNAIRVLNLRRLQVGHVKEAAAVLAPVLDRKLVRADCFVSGPSDGFSIPITISVFGMPSQLQDVKKYLKSYFTVRLDGKSNSNSSIYKRAKKIDVLNEVETLFNSLSNSLLPRAQQSDRITTELMPHQLQGLHWLLEKERSQALPPFWSEKQHSQNGQIVHGFLFSLTNSFVPQRPLPVRGGILADDMGLGKTLMCLSLIAAQPMGSTLVVCPASLMANWKTQAAEHCPSMTVLVFHGANRDRDIKHIQSHELVITTYQTLAAEYDHKRHSGLFAIKWTRVIADEAHQVWAIVFGTLCMFDRYSEIID